MNNKLRPSFVGPCAGSGCLLSIFCRRLPITASIGTQHSVHQGRADPKPYSDLGWFHPFLLEPHDLGSLPSSGGRTTLVAAFTLDLGNALTLAFQHGLS